MNKFSLISIAISLFLFSVKVKAQLTTTNLPIVIVTTTNPVSTSTQQGNFSIIDNASGTNNIADPATYTGIIGIKTRGSSLYPKGSYSIETWSAPNVNLDTAIMGMPSENDWVLLASYADRSLSRSTLALKLHDLMGRYAPRMKHCELVLNGQYQGIYLFGEKIKKDANRLDIATLTQSDNFGDNMTGGYIWKIDDETGSGWTSIIAPPFATTQQINFIYEYPDAGTITPAQKNYIKSYVDSFESALNGASFQDTVVGWRRFGAVNGFADFIIIQELSKNYEAYRINTYMYKDKTKKLRPSPIWGFDVAWKNTASCNSAIDTGWCYNIGNVCPSLTNLPAFWWGKLMTDVSFVKDLKCLYSDYRKPGNILDTAKIFYIIDSTNTRLNAQGAIARNFTQWPIWGTPIVNEPTPMALNYTEEVANLKEFIRKRITWLDSKWILTSGCPAPLTVADLPFEEQVIIYPNPTNNIVNIQLASNYKKGYTVSLSTIQGAKIYTNKSKESKVAIDISAFPQGIYLLTISSEKGIITKKVIKE